MASELVVNPTAVVTENIDVGRDILAELVAERDCLEAAYVHSYRLICEEIEKVKKAQAESQLDAQGNVHVTEKIMINLEDHKQHNLVGRLLGPKGLTLKRMQVEANAKMSILGKGSTRDKKKEDELRESDNPNHAHLKEDLHVLVEVVAPPDQARARLAAGVAEVKKMLVPPLPGAGDPIGDRYRDQDPVLYDQFVGGGRGYPPHPPPPHGMNRGGMRSPGGPPPPGPPRGRGGHMPPHKRGGGRGGRGGDRGKGPGRGGPGRGGRGRGGNRPPMQNSPSGYGDNFANDSNFSSFSDNAGGGYGNTGGGAGGYTAGGAGGYDNNLSYGGTGRGNWKPRDSGGYRHHPYQY